MTSYPADGQHGKIVWARLADAGLACSGPAIAYYEDSKARDGAIVVHAAVQIAAEPGDKHGRRGQAKSADLKSHGGRSARPCGHCRGSRRPEGGQCRVLVMPWSVPDYGDWRRLEAPARGRLAPPRDPHGGVGPVVR